MLTKITINNFKAHHHTTIKLKNLNILTGLNGVGKSSVFQSLLLLRQSFENNNVLKTGLQLNKPLCDIGFINDALYQYSEEDSIEFELESEEYGAQNWKFSAQGNNPNKNFIPILGDSPSEITNLSLFNNNFQYLSAARLSPRETYPLDSNAVETKKQISIEKGQGELVVHFLYYYGIEKKLKVKFANLISKNSDFDDLLSQTTAWEREISPGVNVVPKPSGKSFTLKYTFDKINDIATTNEFSAENVGFGLSYALPIIVAILSAEKDSIILIENPEAHLHPKGQAKLAELLALAANNGIQIIIETHSDHIINGILVACKKFERENIGIDKNLVTINHFTRDENTQSAIVTEINILADGKINKQPIDFFDQTENDLNYLLGF